VSEHGFPWEAVRPVEGETRGDAHKLPRTTYDLGSDMRAAPAHVDRVPPLTRDAVATKRAFSQSLPRADPEWLAPHRMGGSPRGYPVHVLSLELLLQF